MDKNNKIISDFEQVETATQQIAIVMGTYFSELVKNNIPADLAYQLVAEFHRQWWETMIKGVKK